MTHDSVVSCQLKLKLRPAQERLLTHWLWHLTGVYNWTIRTLERGGRRLSLFDLKSSLNGHAAKLGVSAFALGGTVQTAHDAWRRSRVGLGRRARLKGQRNRLNSIAFDHGKDFKLQGDRIRCPKIGRVRFHAQDIPAGRIGCVRLVHRASGWYACLFIHAERRAIVAGAGAVGIDPGFASLLTLSSGEKIEHPRELARGAERLAQAQRGGRKRLTARLHERIGNQRRNRNHHLSRQLVEANGFIAFSKDRTSSIARRFGASVQSAGHSQLRRMLAYKSRLGGGQYVEVDSRNSTRTCSSCGALTGPQGLAGLRVRQWTCACGASHDRDCNAAVNTLIAGRGMCHGRRRETAPGIATRQHGEVHPAVEGVHFSLGSDQERHA